MKFVFPFLTCTTSFATMSYVMITASLVTEITGNEILSQCLTMGPYLLGLGVGSFLGDRVKETKLLETLWRVEWGSVLISPLLPLFQLMAIFAFLVFSPLGTTLDLRIGLRFVLIIGGACSFLTGLLGGAQLPIILKKFSGSAMERILALSYIGPLFAGPFIVYCDSNTISIGQQITFVALIQLMGLLVLFLITEKKKMLLSGLGIALIMIYALGKIYPWQEVITTKNIYVKAKLNPSEFKKLPETVRFIEKFGEFVRLKTPYQSIDLFTIPSFPEYNFPTETTLYLNRKPQFDEMNIPVYHQGMILGGVNILQRKPKNVLILGGGDGFLLKELKERDLFENVTMVELDKGVLNFSRENPKIAGMNSNILLDWDVPHDGIEIRVEDAISFLRKNADKKFDLILIDFPYPNGHELSKLYSFEFYRMVLRVLDKSGVVVIDLPIQYDQNGELNLKGRVVLKTLMAATKTRPMVYGPKAPFVTFRADKLDPQFDYSKFPEDMHMSARLNMIKLLEMSDVSPEIWKKTPVNSMFLPAGF